MKGVTANKWLIRLSSGCLALIFSLLPLSSAYADSFPYLKAYGADVATGGWFTTGNTGCTGSNYQNSGYRYSDNSTQPQTGGIVTYGQTSSGNAAGGSSSQYAAFAMGEIQATSGSPNVAFYSNGAQAGSNISGLSFANYNNLDSSGSSGGNFDGGSPSTDQCIPDYYGIYSPTNPATATPLSSGGLPSELSTSGAYTLSAPTTPGQWFDLAQNGDVTIDPGTKVTLIIKGNVYIGHDITYAPHNASNAPKFLMIVLGNIYIGPGSGHNVGGNLESADELDGWYVAEPDTTSQSTIEDTGTIWTCYDRTDSSDSISSDFIVQNCNTKLVINGALTAKKVNFDRVNGDVNSSTTSDDKTTIGNCGYAVENQSAVTDPACSNVSEIINYSPDMVVGGDFYNPNTSSSPTYTIDKLVSLPPVF